MIDLTSIEKYMIELDNISLSFVNSQIEESGGIEAALNKQLIYLDCTRVYQDGTRPMQTIGYPYRREMSAAIYMAEQLDNNLKEEFLLKLITLHQKNIEFEKINPPVWYDGEKGKKKFEKSNKTGSHPRRREKTEASSTRKAEEKLKAKLLKLNSLTINLKPIK